MKKLECKFIFKKKFIRSYYAQVILNNLDWEKTYLF